jgi:hypothetical protein
MRRLGNDGRGVLTPRGPERWQDRAGAEMVRQKRIGGSGGVRVFAAEAVKRPGLGLSVDCSAAGGPGPHSTWPCAGTRIHGPKFVGYFVVPAFC